MPAAPIGSAIAAVSDLILPPIGGGVAAIADTTPPPMGSGLFGVSDVSVLGPASAVASVSDVPVLGTGAAVAAVSDVGFVEMAPLAVLVAFSPIDTRSKIDLQTLAVQLTLKDVFLEGGIALDLISVLVSLNSVDVKVLSGIFNAQTVSCHVTLNDIVAGPIAPPVLIGGANFALSRSDSMKRRRKWPRMGP